MHTSIRSWVIPALAMIVGCAAQLVAPLTAQESIRRDPESRSQNERVLMIPLDDGRLSMLKLSRTLLSEYGFAGDYLNFKDKYLDLRGLPGFLMLKGLTKALQDSATFHRDGRHTLVVRIDRLRARTMQNKARHKIAAAIGVLTGTDVLQRHYELQVPQGLGATETWVLCVHGVESKPSVFGDFRAFVGRQSDPIKIATFGYANDEAIDRISKELAVRLRIQKRDFPDRRILIVAHSMGGLVARHMLENRQLDPRNVTILIMLGTPNHGSRLSRLRSGLDILNCFELHGGNAKILTPMLDGLGEAGHDLSPGSPFLIDLNNRPRNPAIRYHLILGNRGLVSEDQLSAIRTRALQQITRFRNHEIYEQKAANWLGDLDEVVRGKGDGAVSIERGRLSGVRHIVVPLSHMGLVRRSKTDSEQPAFAPVWNWLRAARDL